jgi:dTDP-4-dehydrorhamnose reductase
MRFLVSGASGVLGSAITDVVMRQGFEVRAFDRKLVWQYQSSQLALLLHGYDCFIHVAANTNVEQCESEPILCYRDNFLLTELLARAAETAAVKFVFISSTGVYGCGSTEPYREFDMVVPTTHHHRSKHLAEQSVLSVNSCNLVVRTGWLFGGHSTNPKNFVARRMEEAIRANIGGATIKSNSEQWGCPSYVNDVAVRTLLLIEKEMSGVFNCVNSGRASRFEYVSAILKLARIPVTVEPISADSFSRKAKVSSNEMAENWKAEQLGLSPMPYWYERLAEYVPSCIY